MYITIPHNLLLECPSSDKSVDIDYLLLAYPMSSIHGLCETKGREGDRGREGRKSAAGRAREKKRKRYINVQEIEGDNLKGREP